MKKTLISIATMIISFCLVFTSLPIMAGSLDAHAIAKKKAKVAKKITLQATATGQDTVSLNWNKIKKSDKGYAVFRNGEPIAYLGKKATSYTDSGLTAGIGYKYQIKTYKSKKVKHWYNTKTGKWQKKKPAKTFRGPSKKLPVYTYKKKSNIVVASTRPTPVKPSAQSTPVSTDSSSNPGADFGTGTDSGTGSDPVTVRGAFSINLPSSLFNSSGEKVININQGEVTIPLTIPEGVKSVTWSLVRIGMADGTNTIELIPGVNGKTLKIKALNALSNRNSLGQVKIKAVFEMQDGYTYYDKDGNGTPNEDSDRTVTSPVITNTVYPMVGSYSDRTYDFEVFNNGIDTFNPARRVDAFSELPTNSIVNININKWNGTYENVGLRVDSDFDLLTPEANCNCILTIEEHSGKILLIQAGTFKLYSDRYDKTIIYKLTGQGDYMMGYHNFLKSVANQCKDSNEIEMIKNCIAYMWTHYYYNGSGGDLYKNGYGDCGSFATTLERLMWYSGLEAHVRSAREVSGQPNGHVNTAIILSDGSKWVADGTGSSRVYTEAEAESWLRYEPAESVDQVRSCRICRWEDYNACYGGSLEFY